jgi:predicted nucleic acid-binding protein
VSRVLPGRRVVVADTGAIVALLDRRERQHRAVRDLYTANRDGWVLPWAILPEVDYLAASHLGARVHGLWLSDLASGAYAIEWGSDADLAAAQAIVNAYPSLELGLVDAVVMAVAERLKADIATLDLRDFGAVRLAHQPRLLPRDR